MGALGYLYALIGRHEEALDLFAEALAVDPLTPINHCMPGFIAVMEGRNSDAMPYYRQFFEMDPFNPFAVWVWGYVLLRNGKVDEASTVIGELRAKHEGSVLAQLGDATVHGIRGDQDAALFRHPVFLFGCRLSVVMAVAGRRGAARHRPAIFPRPAAPRQAGQPVRSGGWNDPSMHQDHALRGPTGRCWRYE